MIDTAYICAAGRSGSTLLSMLIGSHPEAISVSELLHLPKNLALNTVCTCGQHVADCPFWTQVIGRLNRELGTDLFRQPYDLDLGFIVAAKAIDHDKQTRAYRLKRMLTLALVDAEHKAGTRLFTPFTRRFYDSIEQTLRVHEVIRQVSGASVVVNSSKAFRYGVALHQRAPESVRLILLTRDGRGVYYSRIKSGFSRQQSLAAWKTYYQRALPLLDRTVAPAHVLQVRYEDLTRDPRAELARITDFLGLPFSEQMLDFRAKPIHVLNGNVMRKSTSTEIRSDEKWKTELQPDDSAYFAQHGQVLNLRLGYE
jgi:hypothetical protein